VTLCATLKLLFFYIRTSLHHARYRVDALSNSFLPRWIFGLNTHTYHWSTLANSYTWWSHCCDLMHSAWIAYTSVGVLVWAYLPLQQGTWLLTYWRSAASVESSTQQLSCLNARLSPGRTTCGFEYFFRQFSRFLLTVVHRTRSCIGIMCAFVTCKIAVKCASDVLFMQYIYGQSSTKDWLS